MTAERSIYTDHGPIAKPPLVLQSGSGATLNAYNDVSCPGAAFTSDSVGKQLVLSGSLNGGSFYVTRWVSSTRLRVRASFTLPESTFLTWSLVDPRVGEIADDPSDVTVLINGSPVSPESVIGLLGQIVLPTTPSPGDDVKVSYSWCRNPVVEIRRLNSKEFRLNSWRKDVPPRDGSQHSYRYRNVLPKPSDFLVLDPRASIDQPKLRKLKYRAYERAYTASLNDPTTLLLNSPTHRIAFAPASRTVSEEVIRYEGTTLPESASSPWVRKGAGGTASSFLGVLTVDDTSSGAFPEGKPLFWTHALDITFPHVFAASWRFRISSYSTVSGVFTGVAAGYSDESRAMVVGYLEVSGVKKIGLLKRGSTDPEDPDSWTGGLVSGVPTDLPANFDWSVLHSYRLYRDLSGVVYIYVDGDSTAILSASVDDLPLLEEVVAPFDEIQGAFFGALSGITPSKSLWDFYRYQVLPTNPEQSAQSILVSYEANVVPEEASKPWVVIGSQGTGTISGGDYLLLSSTSATGEPLISQIGLVEGDYRSYLRMEPLLSRASLLTVDAQASLLTHTHGVNPNGTVLAVDDGTRLMQLSFLSDVSAPKISYGGRALPEDFTPYVWSKVGGATASMAGRLLKISDDSGTDGLVFFSEDLAPPTSEDRVVSATTDYYLETRLQVLSYTPDGSGFCGAFVQVFDGTRNVGLQLQELSGVRYLQLMSDGISLGASARFAFEWNDATPHTVRLRKSTGGDLVTVFADDAYLGSFPYSSFLTTTPDVVGMVSFGSSTSSSNGSLSVVEWSYVNSWRALDTQRRYVGLWKGTDTGSLLDYHLPVKASGNASIAGNALHDSYATLLSSGVASGDILLVDSGPNRGVYQVAAAVSQTSLTVSPVWPSAPSELSYRVIKETDWSVEHKYRLIRDSSGEVDVLLDSDPNPVIRVGYNSLDLPGRLLGKPSRVSGGLPSISFGSFSSEDLSQSKWDYVRYGISRKDIDQRFVPHHQVLNQRNVMHSPERLFTSLPHTLTDFKSSSTGIVPKTFPDFMADPALEAFTQLNEGTPLVPSTQAFEIRSPYATQEPIVGLNRPENVLSGGSQGFVLNDGTIRHRLIVPDDVLYNSLDVIEHTSGEESLIQPFDDGGSFSAACAEYQKEVCLNYDGSILPEQDTVSPTPWTLASDVPANVTTSVASGKLSYGTVGLAKTLYRNDTPLLDAPGLRSVATFKLKVVSDPSGGAGDSGIRFGLSAPGMTLSVGFITDPTTAKRYVVVFDQVSGRTVGGREFDFLDGISHTYRITRDPTASEVSVTIDS